ncbi:hypothetical protein [Mycobacterium sp. 1274756.6]|uniref:hypothetical protein n=1 Tax=Mycobacterium sp. 1274756.6 TaxID=1834076 RepID=UPI0007FD12EA|nr:hypothetical protein [Mycobacterium sp. 1274756.6]OBJ74427.1 hypothetical protein A5643_00240 [Mycobacterium sp. 1274756.6]
MRYSLQPVSSEQAAAARAAAVKPAAAASTVAFLTLIVAAVAVVALWNVANDGKPMIGSGWLVLLVIAVAVSGLAGWASGILGKRVNYRITKRFGALGQLVAAPVGLLCGFAVLAGFGAFLAPAMEALPGKDMIAFAVLGVSMAVFITPIVFVMVKSILFEGNDNHVGGVKWDSIAGIIYTAGREPGTLEIGLRVRPGVEPESILGKPATPHPVRPGQVLTDLPFRFVVPQRRFHLDGMKWLLNQSGRTDIALIERTPTGERLIGYANSWR